MILILSILIVVLLLIQDAILLILLNINFKNYGGKKLFGKEWPSVSILIPCRNEEKNLPQALAALEQLIYPKDKIQIILGNDNSCDRTGEILQSWCANKKMAEYVETEEAKNTGMNGKAHALHQMAKLASGKLLLFTDADCQVHPQWAMRMVQAWDRTHAGIITGITTVKGGRIFERMQAMDWWLTLGMVKVVGDLGFSVTSMGNNMLVSKEAYEAVGGFKGIPFSLTEDFELARQVGKKGYKHIHEVAAENLIETKAQVDFRKLLSQRKRWMHGAMALPPFWKLILGIQVLFFPAILSLVILHPFEGTMLWFLKVLIQSFFIYRLASKTEVCLKTFDFLYFEIYYLITAWSTIVYYFWPSKTDWKGRKY
ncbi:glycosyltransferase [Cecembia calidifontis]|uniref:Cellulose synthase/poly-beta-1,6-N-acetylglucosamine synthase-like glycosyltransferase n=1 Tax=Cecembia calidifontis TaxID=1187080 RepID=A0A4Q7PF07_9BACT|nr:glycosyltransferase [Cecembia calidifontis]RZS98398.1 cellulose synthase/poly-beta-1,6-N-acetylglucosamine synthase-like glycosyltransferase [Cecembia calidifontis]